MIKMQGARAAATSIEPTFLELPVDQESQLLLEPRERLLNLRFIVPPIRVAAGTHVRAAPLDHSLGQARRDQIDGADVGEPLRGQAVRAGRFLDGWRNHRPPR